MLAHVRLIALAVGLLAPLAAADDDPIVMLRQQMWRDKPVNGQSDPAAAERNEREGFAAQHLDVAYLGAWRDKLQRIRLDHRDHRAKADHPWSLEYRTRADIYVPKGSGPFPALITIHGGSYTGGSKGGAHQWISGRKHSLYDAAAERGYVIVDINYILGSGIHPQVQRDAKELIRFLRAHAERYRIDPHRIAMIGASAGGWLAGSAGMTTADDLAYSSNDMIDGPDSKKRLDRHRDGNSRIYPLPIPADEEQPRFPQFSSRPTVVVADFWHGLKQGSPDDPHGLRFTDPDDSADLDHTGPTEQGNLMTIVELSKRGVHLPDNDQMVDSADGSGQVQLFERVFQFFDNHLTGDRARSPAPEARPNRRVFAEQTEVALVGSGPEVVIHYTTDGSEPTTDSPRFEAPFTVSEDTTVKAIAIAPDMQPSGAMTARFFKGQPALEIQGPEGRFLPPATVGEPYEVAFTAPGATVWTVRMAHGKLDGDNKREGIPAKEPWNKKRENHLALHGAGALGGLPAFPNGDRVVIRGTPLAPGWTTVLVSAIRDPDSPDEIPGSRLWMLRVDPAD